MSAQQDGRSATRNTRSQREQRSKRYKKRKDFNTKYIQVTKKKECFIVLKIEK